MPERPVYALDLRNHGASPHARPMTYEAMVEDLNKFVEGRNLKNVSILGHSMSVFFSLVSAVCLMLYSRVGEERLPWRMHCQIQ